jgi:hypothetical protein
LIAPGSWAGCFAALAFSDIVIGLALPVRLERNRFRLKRFPLWHFDGA